MKIVKGDAIASANVDRNKHYVDCDIENLRRLGELTSDQVELINRVARITANRPKKGVLEVDELVKMETPDFKQSLFPEEQAILPELWKFLEWESVPAPQAMNPLPALTISDRSIGPNGFDPNKQEDIPSLQNAGYEKVARRVQLVVNGDGVASTISIQDLTKVIANPAGFLPDLEACKEILKQLIGRQASVMKAVAEVPSLKPTSYDVPHEGSVKIAVKTQSSLVENRQAAKLNPGKNRPIWGSLKNSLTFYRLSTPTLTVPEGKQVRLIDSQTGREILFESSGNQTLTSFRPGAYRVELWTNGYREESSDVILPVVQGSESVDLTSFLDFELISDGQPLTKTLINADAYGYADTIKASWSYGAPRVQVNSNASEQVGVLVTQFPNLKPGRYAVDFGNAGGVTLDIFSNGPAFATVSGERIRLNTDPSNAQIYSGYLANGHYVNFNLATNQLGYESRVVTVDAAHRQM